MKKKELYVMLLDIENFDKNTRFFDAEEIKGIINEQENLIEKVVVSNGGSILNTFADAYLICFEDISNAFKSGEQILSMIEDYNRNSKDLLKINLRIVLGYGEITFDRGYIFGEVINTLSSIKSVCVSGNMFFTDTVYVKLSEKKGFQIGDIYIKGLREYINLYKLLDKEIDLKRFGLYADDEISDDYNQYELNGKEKLKIFMQNCGDSQKIKQTIVCHRYGIIGGIVLFVLLIVAFNLFFSSDDDMEFRHVDAPLNAAMLTGIMQESGEQNLALLGEDFTGMNLTGDELISGNDVNDLSGLSDFSAFSDLQDIDINQDGILDDYEYCIYIDGKSLEECETLKPEGDIGDLQSNINTGEIQINLSDMSEELKQLTDMFDNFIKEGNSEDLTNYAFSKKDLNLFKKIVSKIKQAREKDSDLVGRLFAYIDEVVRNNNFENNLRIKFLFDLTHKYLLDIIMNENKFVVSNIIPLEGISSTMGYSWTSSKLVYSGIFIYRFYNPKDKNGEFIYKNGEEETFCKSLGLQSAGPISTCSKSGRKINISPSDVDANKLESTATCLNTYYAAIDCGYLSDGN